MKRAFVGLVLVVAAAACWAAVPSEVSRNDATGNDVTQAFAFTFKTPTSDWVEV